MTVELYHFWSSVCSVKARMALEEKGVAWVSRYIDLFRFDQMKPDYLAINPDGVVPTLVHDGAPVRESSIIIEYVDDTFDGPPLKPATALGRARMREFIRLCDDRFPAIVLPTLVKYIVPKLRNRWGEDELRRQAERRPTAFYRDAHARGVAGAVDAAEIARGEADIAGILDRMEVLIAETGGPWLIGTRLTLADIAVAPYFFRLLALGREGLWADDVRPRVGAWYRAVAARPAFKTAVTWPDETGGGYEEVGLSTRR
ncbi:MAG: glutathione S-transferase family protein [Alphaproteobacteria bacterium]|nr:glutathione S-transferase family protein [Alphaproteobacteria bacterium]